MNRAGDPDVKAGATLRGQGPLARALFGVLPVLLLLSPLLMGCGRVASGLTGLPAGSKPVSSQLFDMTYSVDLVVDGKPLTVAGPVSCIRSLAMSRVASPDQYVTEPDRDVISAQVPWDDAVVAVFVPNICRHVGKVGDQWQVTRPWDMSVSIPLVAWLDDPRVADQIIYYASKVAYQSPHARISRVTSVSLAAQPARPSGPPPKDEFHWLAEGRRSNFGWHFLKSRDGKLDLATELFPRLASAAESGLVYDLTIDTRLTPKQLSSEPYTTIFGTKERINIGAFFTSGPVPVNRDVGDFLYDRYIPMIEVGGVGMPALNRIGMILVRPVPPGTDYDFYFRRDGYRRSWQQKLPHPETLRFGTVESEFKYPETLGFAVYLYKERNALLKLSMVATPGFNPRGRKKQ